MTAEQIQEYLDQNVITSLQAQVLNYRRRGYSWRQIAWGMHRSPATIRDHHEAAIRRIATKEQAA